MANRISQKDNRNKYMKNRLDRKQILEEAARIADEKGAKALTIKSLAERLGIKSPSVYKHFSGGLDEINTELMLYGWNLMETEVVGAAVGKSKDDAVISMCRAYRDFTLDHKGLYEIMQWYNMTQSERHLKATEGLVGVMMKVLDGYGLNTEQKVHIVRMVRSFLHGFASIEKHGGYGSSYSTDDTFDFAVRTIIRGISDIKKKG